MSSAGKPGAARLPPKKNSAALLPSVAGVLFLDRLGRRKSKAERHSAGPARIGASKWQGMMRLKSQSVATPSANSATRAGSRFRTATCRGGGGAGVTRLVLLAITAGATAGPCVASGACWLCRPARQKTHLQVGRESLTCRMGGKGSPAERARKKKGAPAE
eukprot:scaffold4279_cov99-Isochrysis_galbana.AAC.8